MIQNLIFLALIFVLCGPGTLSSGRQYGVPCIAMPLLIKEHTLLQSNHRSFIINLANYSISIYLSLILSQQMIQNEEPFYNFPPEPRLILPQPPPVELVLRSPHIDMSDERVREMQESNIYHSFNFSRGKWLNGGFPQLLRFISMWSVRGSLFLHDNRYPTVIQSLTFTSFPWLKILSLKNNLIESIESLPRIESPQLRIIFLDNNLVTNVTPLRRGYWPELTTISLKINKVEDCSAMNCMYAPTFSEIIMSLKPLKDSCANFRWLMKLESGSLLYLDMIRAESVQGKRIQSVSASDLKKKFLQLSIFFHIR